MKISKKDAFTWFSFFAGLPEDEELMPYQQEIVYATFAQIEDAVEDRRAKLRAEIGGLRQLQGRTYFVGNEKKFPRGCKSCLFGTGLSAIRKTNKCNIQCRFCYDYGQLDCQPPVGEGMWEIGGMKFREEDLDMLLSVYQKPTGIAYVYLEPFMEIEKYYGVIKKFHEAGIHQHMYTNGTLANDNNLRMLGEAGLNELRFNLGASNCSDQVIENIKRAKQYIPLVGIETPMTREFFDKFFAKKEEILSTGLDFINCAELHLSPNNIENYDNEAMYIYRHGYISPIFSGDLTLEFMAIADREKWDMAVHDCSNHTKFVRDLNLRAKSGGWFGASNYICEFQQLPYWAFLATLEDDTLVFLEEEPLPVGYRPGDLWF